MTIDNLMIIIIIYDYYWTFVVSIGKEGAMKSETRLDRLNQGLDRLDTGGKLYIERLTSRLFRDNASDRPIGPEKIAKTAIKTAGVSDNRILEEVFLS